MHGLAVSSSHLLLLRYSWPQQPLRKILSSSWKTEMSTFLHVCVWSSRATSPISHHPSFLRADMRGQLSDSPPPQPSVSVSKRSDMQLKFERASLALLTHTFSFMHALTQVAPCSDSSPQLIWSIKQGRLAGLHCDTSFALRGCNWSAFQRLSFSGKNAIKADSICWISFCQTHGPALCFQLRNYQLCPENNNHFFSLPPASLGLSLSE